MKVVKCEGSGTVTVLREFVRCSAAARNAAESTVCAPAGTTPSRSGKPTSTAVAHPTTHTAMVPLALLFFCAILKRTTRILLVVRRARDGCLPERDHALFAFLLVVRRVRDECLPERDHALFAFLLPVVSSLSYSCAEGAFSRNS